MSDEVYEHIVFDGNVSSLASHDLWSRSFVMSFEKHFTLLDGKLDIVSRLKS